MFSFDSFVCLGVILDDLDLSNKEIEMFQIKTDGVRGLTKENVEEAIKMLNYYDI